MTRDQSDEKEPPSQVTELLNAWQEGRQGAVDELMPLVYQELRKLARSYMRNERPDHTLQATALVNEAYLRLMGQKSVQWENRKHTRRAREVVRIVRPPVDEIVGVVGERELGCDGRSRNAAE